MLSFPASRGSAAAQAATISKLIFTNPFFDYFNNIGMKRLFSARFFLSSKAFVGKHKILSGLMFLVLLGVGYYAYGKITSTAGDTRYVLANVEKGTIIATVSGSGQISTSRQIDLKPEVSGKITYVGVKAGQQVKAGTLIAQIDATDASKVVRDAKNNLETAKLSLAKLKEPASGLTLLQAQNSLTQAEQSLATNQNALVTTYQESYTDVTNAFLDFPTVITGLQNMLLATDLSKGVQWNIDFYRDQTKAYADATAYRDSAYNDYLTAQKEYDAAFAAYKAVGTVPDQATTEALLASTAKTATAISTAAKSANNLIQFYSDQVTRANKTPIAAAGTQLSTLNTYLSQSRTHETGLLADINSIQSSKNAIENAKTSIAEKKLTLADIEDGADSLDIRSSELTVAARENTLADAYTTLAKYSLRAPFDGQITSVDGFAGDMGGSAAIATLITNEQIAELSLNEVDAAKVKVSNKVTLTFDAFDDLTLTGSVAEVDTVGTVAQGVVSYSVKIKLDTQDERVKSGMTVNATIQVATRQDVLMVPSSAVKSQNNASYVLVFDPPLAETGDASGIISKTLPRQVPVTVGISDDTNVEILTGLSENEQIVTKTTTGTATTQTTTTTGGNRRGGFGGPGAIRL